MQPASELLEMNVHLNVFPYLNVSENEIQSHLK